MAIIESEIDSQSAQFKSNWQEMYNSVLEFKDIELKVIKTAEAKAPRYIKRGLLPPRERLATLIDLATPFIELSTLCGYMQNDDTDGSAAGGGCITGIGYVSGVRCMIMVDDYLTKGGTISTLGSEKRKRMLTIALEHKLPVVTLAQSGGGNLKELGNWFGYSGSAFFLQSKLSAAGIPQITVVHGSATAGGAYQPGLSDYVIMIRKQTTVYLAGPPLLKAATGEIATDEEIGGAEMHSEVAGTADYLAENDADGIRIAREVVDTLGWSNTETAKSEATIVFKEPNYDKDDLLGIVPVDNKMPYDVREIIARLSDNSNFVDFKKDYDLGTVCGHVHFQGYVCGVIGNNGPITAKGAAKSGQFIQLCEQSGVPLLFLHNTTGFLVGTESEQAGIIKHGAKLIQTITNSTIPKISVVVGGSYGAGNYAMCGRGIAPNFMFAWPRTVVSVMGPPQAGSVMRTVAEAKMSRSGNVDVAQLDAIEADVITAMEERSHALANTARLWDDGIIDPRDTRAIISFVLSIFREAKERQTNKSSFGVARF